MSQKRQFKGGLTLANIAVVRVKDLQYLADIPSTRHSFLNEES